MEKKETTAILALMKMSYPRFYPATQSPDDVTQTIDLWHDIFKNDDFEVVKIAVMSLIQQLEYPPTIADVRKEINKLVASVLQEPTAIDEWNAIKKALKSSAYYSVECFENLPTIAKKFVGSPTQLKDWATSSDFSDSVVRGQFLKQYDILKEREKTSKLLTGNVKSLINNMLKTQETKLLEGENK